MAEDRIRRARFAALATDVDRLIVPPSRTPPIVLQVIDNGSKPTTVDRYFACKAVDPGGLEAASGSGTFALSDGTICCLVVGEQVPDVDDRLIAHSIGGRWVAKHGVGSSCTGRICVFQFSCHDPAVSATVTLKDADDNVIGTGTTDLLGQICFNIGHRTGDFTVTVTSAEYPDATGTVHVEDPCQLAGVTVSLESEGTTCCFWCPDAVPSGLVLSDDNGTWPMFFGVNPAFGPFWCAGYTLSVDVLAGCPNRTVPGTVGVAYTLWCRNPPPIGPHAPPAGQALLIQRWGTTTTPNGVGIPPNYGYGQSGGFQPPPGDTHECGVVVGTAIGCELISISTVAAYSTPTSCDPLAISFSFPSTGGAGFFPVPGQSIGIAVGP